MRRPRMLGALLLTMTFVVGGLGGMALEEAAGIDWFDFLDEDAPSEDSGGDRAFLMQMDLTEQQRARIDEIFEEQDDQMEAHWRSQLPALHGIVRQGDTKIAAVLSPEQRALFEQRIKDRGASVPARQSDYEHQRPYDQQDQGAAHTHLTHPLHGVDGIFGAAILPSSKCSDGADPVRSISAPAAPRRYIPM